MSDIPNFIKKIFDLPKEITPTGKFLVLPEKKEEIEKLFTQSRLKIIHFLKEENPIKETKLSELMGFDVHKDVIILNHIKILNVQKVDENNKNNIITLNREIKIV